MVCAAVVARPKAALRARIKAALPAVLATEAGVVREVLEAFCMVVLRLGLV